MPGYVATPAILTPTRLILSHGEPPNRVVKGGVISGSRRANGDPVVSAMVRAYLIRDAREITLQHLCARVRRMIAASMNLRSRRAPYRFGGCLGNQRVFDPYGGDVRRMPVFAA